MAKKRTFGELKQGSYIWAAGIGCVMRRSVVYINHSPSGCADSCKVCVACGHFRDLTAYIDKNATEFNSIVHHWFTDKQDARKCAYQLLMKDIREKEQEVNCLKMRAKSFRENFLPEEDS